MSLFLEKCFEAYDIFQRWKRNFNYRVYHSELNILLAFFRSSKGRYIIPMFGEEMSLGVFLQYLTPNFLGTVAAVSLYLNYTSMYQYA